MNIHYTHKKKGSQKVTLFLKITKAVAFRFLSNFPFSHSEMTNCETNYRNLRSTGTCVKMKQVTLSEWTKKLR